MKTFLYALALAAIASPALAQTIPMESRVNWTLPTESECLPDVTPCVRVPLTGNNALTAIELFVSESPIPDSADTPTAVFAANATSAVHAGSATLGNTLYYRVRARTARGVSRLSGQASKVVEVDAVPGVPTIGVITLSVRVPTPPVQ